MVWNDSETSGERSSTAFLIAVGEADTLQKAVVRPLYVSFS